MAERAPKAESLQVEQENRLREKLRRELGQQICEFLENPDVIEIVLNPDGRLWVEKMGARMEQFGKMLPHQAEAAMTTIASVFKTTITRESPIIECELPFDGSRFEGLIPPVVQAPTFAIRRRALRIFTLDEYVGAGIMTPSQRETICHAIDAHENILVVGGTGSGKTTLTNAIIDHISKAWPHERLLIIEDTNELQCASDNHVQMRSTVLTDMLTLLKATLRLRPDRILVGEVRGPEAMVLIDSWNTGHPGGIATVHANNAVAGLTRIEALVRRGLVGPPPVQEIAAAIGVIVHIAKTPTGRRVQEVVRVSGHDGNDYNTQPI